MKEFKLIVAGGRDFTDAEHLSRVLFAMADVELADHSLRIVSRTYRGVEILGRTFAKANGINQQRLFNHESMHYMCEISDGLLAFHNGSSRSTAQLIEIMQSLNKPVTVIPY